MTGSQHKDGHAAAGRVSGRAMFSAWAVFLSMAGTTMTFQVFHAIRYGAMPWELAVLYGVVPLAISVGVLDFVAEWEDSPTWASWAAYMITGGAMFLSAAATGTVVLHAAPPRLSGLFGLLLDAAALLSIRFILTAPRTARLKAAQEGAERAAAELAHAEMEEGLRRELAAERDAHAASARQLREELEAERHARTEAEREAERRAAAEAERNHANAALETARQAHEAEARGLRDELDTERLARARAQQEAARRTSEQAERGRSNAALQAANARVLAELEAERAAREAAERARTEADANAVRAEEKAARLTRKLEANAAPKNRKESTGKNRDAAHGTTVPSDVDARAQALEILDKDPNITGKDLGELCGMGERWGQMRKKEYAGHVTGNADTVDGA
jgi:hypothetical protein